MKNSSQRIVTSHAGSLPRPDDLIDLNRARQAGETQDEGGYQERLRSAVQEVVRRQRDTGVDVPGDGEYGKAMGQRVNYGAWWSYSFQRLGGLALGTEIYKVPPRRSEFGQVRLTSFSDRRDRQIFAAAYADPDAGVSTMPRSAQSAGMRLPVCVGPLTYTGHDAIKADIEHVMAALRAAGVDEGFMTSIAPAAPPASATSTTRPTRSSSTPAPTPCARSTRPSSTPGSCSSSTTPPSPRTGT